MFIRLSRVTRSGKTYQYAQLVESVRREGHEHPVHHVLASLGRVSDVQAQNLKIAFDANKVGAQVVALAQGDLGAAVPEVVANRAWLDVVAALEVFRSSGLREVVQAALGNHADAVAAVDVITALVLQRCVAPDSKLAAVQWFASTALPELLDIAPASLNNSRIHRVMSRLDLADTELQAAMGEFCLSQPHGPLVALFMDVTDTWFFGDGPSFAITGKTKEGMLRKKINIVLLCDQRGLPLRFSVHEGNIDDGVAMLGLLTKMGSQGWLGSVPLMLDRAVGNTSDFLAMRKMGLQFVTAMCAAEHGAYSVEFPGELLAAIDPDAADAIARAERIAEQWGMVRIAEDLFIRDLGLVRRGSAERVEANFALADEPEALNPDLSQATDRARQVLLQARAWQEQIDAGTVRSKTALARGLGLKHTGLLQRMRVLDLPVDLQAEIEAGNADRLSLIALVRIAKQSTCEEQRAAFAQELAVAPAVGKLSSCGKRKPVETPCVRVVVAFNPLIWQQKSRHAKAKAGKVHAAIRKVQAAATAGASTEELQAQAAALLAEHRLADMYRVRLQPAQPGKAAEVGLELNATAWAKQRGCDGLLVIAAAPGLDRTGEELVRLYRSKALIERDFREIKSVLELRPLRHSADDKVRAHVTLCVLALAIERLLEQRLASAGQAQTAQRALATLRQVELNELMLTQTKQRAFVVTTPGAAALGLAKALDVSWALDQRRVGERLHNVGR
jgi:hypothetical protein